METEGHMDWLEITFPADLDQAYWLPSKLHKSSLTIVGKRTANYSLMLTNNFGVIVLTKGEQREGTHIVYAGDPLYAIRASGTSDKDLIMHLQEYDGTITRLDLAIDLYDGYLTADDLERAYLARQCKTKARKAEKRLKLNTEEQTLYVGSRTSERFFRAYNKGAQLGDGEAWLRLELELKRLAARQVGAAIVVNPNERAVINKAIRNYVDFPSLPEYQLALEDVNATIQRPQRKMHSTYRWLLELVAPALAKYQFEHPDEPVEQAFLTAWHIRYADLLEHAPNLSQDLHKP